MDSDNIKLTYVSCGMNKDLTLQWIHQIKDVSAPEEASAKVEAFLWTPVKGAPLVYSCVNNRFSK